MVGPGTARKWARYQASEVRGRSEALLPERRELELYPVVFLRPECERLAQIEEQVEMISETRV